MMKKKIVKALEAVKGCLPTLCVSGLLRGALLLSFFLIWAPGIQAMEAMTDGELGKVEAREGVLISFDYYLNSEKTGDPATDGRQDASFCGQTLGDMNCRFTWQIAGREDGEDFAGLTGAQGEWLVYKDGYASLDINRISFDASYLGEAGSASGTSPEGIDYEDFFNATRFEDVNGDCLLTDGEGNDGCSVSNIKLMPALKTHYPETGGSYNPGDGSITGYNDVRLGMRFNGLAVEYTDSDTSTPGYVRDQNGSFMGLNIADNNGHQAGIAFGGDFYMYGF